MKHNTTELSGAVLTKWCSHCAATSHNDDECNSTRGMNEPDPWWFLSDADRCDGDDPRAEVYEAAWGRAQDAFDSIKLRGASEWQDKVRLAVRALAASAPEVFAAEIAALSRREPATPTPGDPMSSETTAAGGLAYRAMMFAREAHKDQRRKYTGNPYTDHLAEVAGIVSSVADLSFGFHEMIAVAWLHDCREDQGVTGEEIEVRFGMRVAVGVSLLSDFETGNRAERKAASRARLADAPGWVQTIKCADLISNTSSIVMHDPKFAAVYLEEKRLLLDVLTKADPRLLALARAQSTPPAP